MCAKHTGNYWIKNKNSIAIILCSIEENKRGSYLFSIDKFIEILVSRQRNNR